jgi:hypothetical protein
VRERAENIVNRMQKYGQTAIPKTEIDLVCWSDLACSSAVETKSRNRAKTPKEVQKVPGL